jgi:energy-converting hydrogenase Eha subunit H
MTAMYGMMAMMPILFGSAGYVLVSSAGTTEHNVYKTDE